MPTRIRLPGAKACPIASSLTVAVNGSPGTSAWGCSSLSRWVRFWMARVTSAEVPSANTSHRRTHTSARGRSEVSVSSTSGNPRISSRSASGSDVNVRLMPSMARWSPGQSAGSPYGHHDPASRPAVCTPREAQLGRRRRVPLEPAGVQVHALRRHARRRPGRLGHPPARPLGVAAARPARVLDVGPQHRLVHDPGVDAAEPVVEPAPHLLQKPDRRPGRPRLRPGVRPRADQPLARAGQTVEEPRDRVRVAVRPAADRVDGGLDAA